MVRKTKQTLQSLGNQIKDLLNHIAFWFSLSSFSECADFRISETQTLWETRWQTQSFQICCKLHTEVSWAKHHTLQVAVLGIIDAEHNAMETQKLYHILPFPFCAILTPFPVPIFYTISVLAALHHYLMNLSNSGHTCVIVVHIFVNPSCTYRSDKLKEWVLWSHSRLLFMIGRMPPNWWHKTCAGLL